MIILAVLLGVYALIDVVLGIRTMLNGDYAMGGTLLGLGILIILLLIGDRLVMRYGSHDRVRNYQRLTQ